MAKDAEKIKCTTDEQATTCPNMNPVSVKRDKSGVRCKCKVCDRKLTLGYDLPE